MIALIDADILVYRVGYTTLTDPENIAMARMDESIGKILEFLGTNDYRCYLTSSDHSNFRYDIHPEYKANRVQKKPTHYHLLRDFLLNCHGAEMVYGQEADDALAQAQTDDTVIVSIDKDLDQILGKHFNFVRGILYEVVPPDHLRSLYRSILSGDATDNIPGIRGIGKVYSSRMIDHLLTEREMYDKVLEEYTKAFKEDAERLLVRNASLLYIRTLEGRGWHVPVGE